ncbi:protein FAM151A [Denticeps clupeoides]|uniref:protein FAM151A n=1 Tax=Denticeps clupeoides TaxID=299321 RepID=UPI0010A5A05E|nr:protein FAM151A [Denticeps clupeoides]
METKEGAKEDKEQASKTICGISSRKLFLMLCIGFGISLLTVTLVSVAVILNQGSSDIPFATDGDMLDFLVRHKQISEKDGLFATWYHSANSIDEMNAALQSSAMVLEADVNIEGYGTTNQTNVPIMAHPPNIYSDNTLQEWLDAVLKSKKGIKLDFKSLQSVEPSLDILRVKNQSGINRPVWLNADIMHGPNVPGIVPVVDATRFLKVIQQKFPQVTISPGWKVLYIPIFPNVTYTHAMVEKMYKAIQQVPQKVTFPILALMARRGWPHISWLLSQSSRFSLTLWQGKENPTVKDLLFIRDNSSPQRIYYDIYEPVLSQFKEAAKQRDRLRLFYPGGDLIDYFRPENKNGSNIQWETVAGRASLLSLLRERSGGMLAISVVSRTDGRVERNRVESPVVEGSDTELSLQECLHFIFTCTNPWGVYLHFKSHSQLKPSLRLLSKMYDEDLLHHPIWVSMEVSHGAFQTPGYMSGVEFINTVEEIFPYVTLAPSWPKEALGGGYTPALIVDMLHLLGGVHQMVSLQLNTKVLSQLTRFHHPLNLPSRFSITLDQEPATSYTWQQRLKCMWGLVNQQKLFFRPSGFNP